MNTTSSLHHPVPLSSNESLLSSSSTVLPSIPPPPSLPSLIPRSAIVDHNRIKSRTGGVDIDTNILSTTIKRSQAISNIQDLDEDSPVTFEIEPNEHNHPRKKVQLQTNSTPTSNRTINESISSIDKQQTNSSSGGGDESDTRSESSEKTPECVEEERPILTGILVKGATLNRLIRILIDSFRE
jgi:hypothetical protein